MTNSASMQEPTLAGNRSETTADLTRTDVREKTEIRLSPLTLRSLDSLASTNPGIVNFNRTVLARAKTDQELPPFVLEYLPSFLLAHGKFEAPVVEFGEKELLIRGGDASQVFAYADSRFIRHFPPYTRIELPSVDVEFTLSEKQVETIRDYYGVAIVGNDSEVVFRWEDIESIIPDSYKVSVSLFKGSSRWVGSMMEYFVPIELRRSKPGTTRGVLNEVKIEPLGNKIKRGFPPVAHYKDAMFDALSAEGFAEVTVEFSGDDDDGEKYVREIKADDTKLTEYEITNYEFLTDAIKMVSWHFLQETRESWQHEEQYVGRLTFDVAKRLSFLSFEDDDTGVHKQVLCV